MDRGTAVLTIDANPCDIQICRLHMGDGPGTGMIFITANYSGKTQGEDPYPIDGAHATWPTITNVKELDATIAALQSQRHWLEHGTSVRS